MNLRRLFAAALAVALVGAAPLPTVYTAPAGSRPAGAPRAYRPYDVILPNGRTVAPVGKSVVVGMNALGVALSPDGRYAVVSNDDGRQSSAVSRIQPLARGGYSLAVVDTKTMRLTDVYRDPSLALFVGVAVLKDPANPHRTLVLASTGTANTLRYFTLDAAGRLHPQTQVAMPLPADPQYANQGRAFPGSITLSANHRIAYVVNTVGDSVTAVDIASRRVLHSALVGFFPYAAGVAGRRLYVTDPGLMNYTKLAHPAPYPPFGNVQFAPAQGSALTTVDLAGNGNIVNAVTATRMDEAPDGVNNVGGAQPSAIAISKNGRYAYVCMTNVDRVAIVDLSGIPRVVGGLQLRLFDRAPYGTQPDAIVRSPDGTRLYVALAGMNAVAVLDARNPRKLHRLGLIPTGWYPAAIAVSPTGRFLYVANAKGIGEEPGFHGGPPFAASKSGRIIEAGGDSNQVWATLQRIDLHRLPLEKTTFSTLRYTRVAQRPVRNPIVPTLRSLQRSTAIKHVVFILEENKTYDAMLGDLTDVQGMPYGNGDPALVSFGKDVTPNLHALALQYGLATNFYADAEEPGAGHQFAAGGVTTAYSEKTLLVKNGRGLYVDKNQDPEDYPRSGYIFNNAERAGLSYRDYGDLVRLSGYQARGTGGASPGLGGVYSLNVPALAALKGHIDLNYPGWNPRISDVERAKEFVSDYSRFEKANAVPDLTYIWLPGDEDSAGPGIPSPAQQAANADRALGMIVQYLTHQPSWASTAIFVTADAAQSSRDHVSEHRTYALVISPYAKHHYIGKAHLSTVSILKTEEEILGLPPLSLNDLLATDMSGFFTDAPDAAPFTAIPVPEQTAGVGSSAAETVRRAAAGAL